MATEDVELRGWRRQIGRGPRAEGEASVPYGAPLVRHDGLARRIAVAVVALCLVASTPTFAGTDKTEAGRSLRTGPKGVQTSVDGEVDPRDVAVMNDITGMDVTAPSGRRLGTKGRYLRARPGLDVTVGLMGCPGCMETLDRVGGVIVDARRFRRLR